MLTGLNVVAKSWVALGLLVAGVVAGCTTVPPVADSVIASCVRAQGFTDGTRYSVEDTFTSYGATRRVMPSADIPPEQADAINRCIESQAVSNEALPTVEGVPQSVTTTASGGTVKETFTYGTPPASRTGNGATVRETFTYGTPPATRTASTGHQSASGGYCLPTSSVMQRGASYCIGN